MTPRFRSFVADLMTMPLDRSRPLWHMYLIDGYGDGAAMICRMHHCIADGIALARVMLSLTDAAPDGEVAPPAVRNGASHGGGSATESVRDAIGDLARFGVSAVSQGTHIVTSPSYAARLAGAIARDSGTAVRLLLTPSDAATAIKGDPGISRRVAWTDPIPLSGIKRIAHSHHATVNDVLLAAVTGALRHYLQDRGGPVAEIQAMVPFNLRPLDQPVPHKLGNRFGLVFLPLPVGTSGSYRRLVEVRHRMQEIKDGRDGAVSYGLLSLTGLAPEPLERRIIDMFTAKTTAVITNVPGPSEPVYVAGTPVRAVLVWAPTSGHMGMSVSIFSYRGEVTVGLMVDAALVPDPDHIAGRLSKELEALRPTRRSPRRTPGSRQRTRAGRKERSDA